MKQLRLPLIFAIALFALPARADERFFTYSYQADVLPEGEAEFEQYLTNQSGKEHGDYSEWNFRSAIEYGITSRLMTAFYLNWDSLRQDGSPGEDSENNTDFRGVSSEWIYQFLNPNLDPIGLAVYAEYSTDGIDQELEGKLLISKRLESWELATNVAYEAESEKEGGQREREATLILSAGAAYKLSKNWSAGLELRNKTAYPGGLDLSGQEYQVWSVGPNIKYGASKWWATLTVLPQVWGNGDGSKGSRQLEHEESLETRLIFGIDL